MTHGKKKSDDVSRFGGAARWRAGDARLRGVVRAWIGRRGNNTSDSGGGGRDERGAGGERERRRGEERGAGVTGVTGVRSGSERRSDGRRREVREYWTHGKSGLVESISYADVASAYWWIGRDRRVGKRHVALAGGERMHKGLVHQSGNLCEHESRNPQLLK
ncbi:hypothetical protein Scep_014933 [Stephania cephalantha]|uniref:Uncharacterized protein n=1 Tax=Stephania cephalantha TaxID=152367 RepID=A0AAP0J1Y6_9MAGN